MTVDLNCYRARIGYFHIKSTRNPNLPYIDSITKLYLFLFLSDQRLLPLAVFISILVNLDLITNLPKTIKSKTYRSNEHSTYTTNCKSYAYSSIVKRIQLILSGNVETNPGPTGQNQN